MSAWNGFIDCELPPWDPDRTPDSVIYIYRRRQPSSSPHISVKKTTRMIGASELPISVCSTTTTAPPTRQLPHSFLAFHPRLRSGGHQNTVLRVRRELSD